MCGCVSCGFCVELGLCGCNAYRNSSKEALAKWSRNLLFLILCLVDMPRYKAAKETSDECLRREMKIAEALCKQEEDDMSDAETLDSDYETESTEDEESYESDFIDDSDIDVVPANKWKSFDIRSMEDSTFTGNVWRPCAPYKR